MESSGARIAGTMRDLVFESTRTVTQAEFAAWVESRERARDIAHYELLHGRIVMTPPAGYPHGEIGLEIGSMLHEFVRAKGLGKCFDSSQGFELPTGDTVEPDVSFVSRERWEAAPPPEPGKFLKVVPDLVIEILSPSTASQDRGEKKGIYERAGVREYWLVDSRAREIVVFVLVDGRYGKERIFTPGGTARSEILRTEAAAFEIDPAEVFPA